jgi:hypothetical protein
MIVCGCRSVGVDFFRRGTRLIKKTLGSFVWFGVVIGSDASPLI